MNEIKQRLQGIVDRDATHECAGIGKHALCVRAVAVADLPTRFGDFRIVAFWNNRDEKDHVAIILGHGDEPFRSNRAGVGVGAGSTGKNPVKHRVLLPLRQGRCHAWL